MRTRIKICGITDPDTARVAVDCGADAIGLMFYPPSSRHLSHDDARRVRDAVGPFVDTVAVMVNPSTAEVEAILELVMPSCLQFHGEEEDAFCRSFGRPYIKALRVADDTDLLAAESRYPGAAGILLDTHVSDRYGGTGERFDWTLADYGGGKPIILAGGLTVDTVAQAVGVARPYAVDISSGVESNGRKDPVKIREFCRAVQTLNH